MDDTTLPDWSLIRAFLAVADTGSLSAAARRLGQSQPTLGRQIRALESQLGDALFHRHPRGLALTEAGRDLLEPAQAMAEAAGRFALTAAGRASRLEGTVRITASLVVSAHHLPALIARIRTAEPAIAIDLVPSDTTSNLLYRKADIAVRMYRPTRGDLVARHLGDLAFGVYAARSYLARRGRPRRAEDLLTHDVVGYDRTPLIEEGFRAAGLPVTREFFKVRCDDPVSNWALVRAGCGIGFAQRSVGRTDPAVEELTEFAHLVPRLPIWLTAAEAMRSTPRIRRVWDLLAEGLSPLVS